MSNSKRILIYGDSNTWGWAPAEEVAPSQRHSIEKTWVHLLNASLGQDVTLIGEGLSGRTAGMDDPESDLGPAAKNGLKSLPVLIASHMPLDYVVIALGTNDVKHGFHRSTFDIALDILRLAAAVKTCTGVKTIYQAPKPMVIAPPPIGQLPDIDWLHEVFDEESCEKSRELPQLLGNLCHAAGIPFISSCDFVKIEGCDGVHLTEANHQQMADGLKTWLLDVL